MADDEERDELGPDEMVAKLVKGGHLVATDTGAYRHIPAGQLTREDLRRMAPEDILKAEKDGRLEALRSGAKAPETRS